ncbi:substrate-binding domain-containing protein [uncultured Anaerofustis sp.]|uniref:PstS family phosphate ABC transporter substrate-binding protein n=1 Tax=uncultured Anaerofustis sp. TaxID=904996 RepID=UPI0025E9EA46|nr:substrate-binding domain-containing protein [uncultured Anaerofustis sp.]
MKGKLSGRDKIIIVSMIFFVALFCIINYSFGGFVFKVLKEKPQGEEIAVEEVTQDNLFEYAPFFTDYEGKEEYYKNIVTIKNKNKDYTFNKMNELPSLDGATAMYPAYSAFVRHTYKPLEDYTKKIADARKAYDDFSYKMEEKYTDVSDDSYYTFTDILSDEERAKYLKLEENYYRLIGGNEEKIYKLNMKFENLERQIIKKYGNEYEDNEKYKKSKDKERLDEISYESNQLIEENEGEEFVNSDKYPLSIIKCSKTPMAYENLINGKADIIFCAAPSVEHLEKVKKLGDEFVLTKIGSDAFVFINNKNSSINNLSSEQIVDIYSGKVNNWKDVGGKDEEIKAYQRPENSGSQTTMQKTVMKNKKMRKAEESVTSDTMSGIIRDVSEYRNSNKAIGYSFLYYINKMHADSKIKCISIDGIKPTKENIKNGKYPYITDFYAVTLKSNKDKNVKKMIEFIKSDEGKELLEKSGYITN